MTRSISQAAKILSPVTGPTIPQVIRNNVDVAGGFRFILPHGEERSYDRAQLNDEFDRRGQHLLALGLKKGDRVGLILPSNEEAEDNYNYSDNTILVRAIANGARGAYWDILRKLG